MKMLLTGLILTIVGLICVVTTPVVDPNDPRMVYGMVVSVIGICTSLIEVRRT